MTKCEKKSKNTLFWSFWKKLLQSVTNRERFTNLKTFITKCGKKIIRKCDKCTKWERTYSKVLQVLLGVTRGYYKVWQVWQSVTVIAKWDITPHLVLVTWYYFWNRLHPDGLFVFESWHSQTCSGSS